ncbi:unnamed protein product, partial [Polarella glacialis]
MQADEDFAEQVKNIFRQHDSRGCGRCSRGRMLRVLGSIGAQEALARKFLDTAYPGLEDQIDYCNFIDMLFVRHGEAEQPTLETPRASSSVPTSSASSLQPLHSAAAPACPTTGAQVEHQVGQKEQEKQKQEEKQRVLQQVFGKKKHDNEQEEEEEEEEGEEDEEDDDFDLLEVAGWIKDWKAGGSQSGQRVQFEEWLSDQGLESSDRVEQK